MDKEKSFFRDRPPTSDHVEDKQEAVFCQMCNKNEATLKVTQQTPGSADTQSQLVCGECANSYGYYDNHEMTIESIK